MLNHITGGHLEDRIEAGPRSFQPMNINFGLFPEPELATDGPRLKGKERGRAKKRTIAVRALDDVNRWLATEPVQQSAAE